jgi:hypothetical protein
LQGKTEDRGRMEWKDMYTHTHTHTHTQREREREREGLDSNQDEALN